MFCKNCGKEIENGAKFCASCDTPVQVENSQNSQEMPAQNGYAPTHHDIPKCTCCGNVAPWKEGPLFRTMDFVIGIGLLLFGFVPGLVYMGVVGLIRSDKKNREKICTKCNARNLFTNLY